MLIESVLTVLTPVAEGIIGSLTASATASLAQRLKGDPVKQALKQALGSAIVRYANSRDWRGELAKPLLKDSPLAHPAVLKELAKLADPNGTSPDVALIGRYWKQALDQPPIYRDFGVEAQELVTYLHDELRVSEVFGPTFDHRDLNQLAEHAEIAAHKLADIDARLAALYQLELSRLHAQR